MILIGPFLTRASGTSLGLPPIENTGYVLEFASPSQGARIPIYKRHGQGFCDFYDYLIRAQDIPFSMTYRPYQAEEPQHGLFLRLESLIAALYQEHEVARPLLQFLGEFRDCLPLEKIPFLSNTKPWAAFKPELAAQGFYLVELFSYSRTIQGSVAWYCPRDRDNLETAPYFSAGGFEFRPRPDRTLNPGKWLEPLPGNLFTLLRGLLRKQVPGSPLDLFSEQGKQIVLDAFQWTPLARMTRQEARRARVEFARKHPELHNKPHDLALALRQAQLYSETTSVGNIRKQLAALIFEATKSGA